MAIVYRVFLLENDRGFRSDRDQHQIGFAIETYPVVSVMGTLTGFLTLLGFRENSVNYLKKKGSLSKKGKFVVHPFAALNAHAFQYLSGCPLKG
jgi:hypothetical protein